MSRSTCPKGSAVFAVLPVLRYSRNLRYLRYLRYLHFSRDKENMMCYTVMQARKRRWLRHWKNEEIIAKNEKNARMCWNEGIIAKGPNRSQNYKFSALFCKLLSRFHMVKFLKNPAFPMLCGFLALGMSHPLKQGLRQLPVENCAICRLLGMSHPLKQGLRRIEYISETEGLLRSEWAIH